MIAIQPDTDSGPRRSPLPGTSCRLCREPLKQTFVDLGMSPLANAYVRPEDAHRMEPFYPLHVYVCHRCLLVQLPMVEPPERIFSGYAYFSSYCGALVENARAYTDMMVGRFGFDQRSRVVEIASNDGYLLRFFAQRGVPVLGIEPADEVAQAAQDRGIPTLTQFFSHALGEELAAAGLRADLVIGNNVIAHVPDVMDFLAGIVELLKPGGIVTMEFPHILHLMARAQFDTIYHEHLSYFSFGTVQRMFAAAGLTIFDVEELPVHGGSLRVYGCLGPSQVRHARVADLHAKEEAAGLTRLEGYTHFAARALETKHRLLDFFIEAKRKAKSVVGYGAPAKSTTLLNYCGIRHTELTYTVDLSPHKQGLLLPGTHIPIYPPDRIRDTRPDYVLVLPWNLKDEIEQQMADIRQWGGRFVVPIPEVRVC